MKRRRIEQPERRRRLVELSLIGSEVRSGPAARARGCASLLSRLMVDTAIVVIVLVGLR